ncbi:hypothetical protein Leryth_022581 [Lithospermum erythrorhizon]|uniref:Uncharacterized protein n=1 Tax=Lithospermum erythrorhizon TaxID=34254 RepID=A0AAV3QG99_LITER|nr:hypothetical protein Leryth_022581 [Lithospermum erythrorhizon]
MASLYSLVTVTIFILLLQQPWQILSDDILAPFLSPIFDGPLCKGVKCGKGSCKASENGTLGFECVCDPGWKQFRQGNDSSGFSFMPCVIPNCSLDYSCTEGSSVQSKDKQANASFLDPCHWADCGGGMCNKTSLITYKCECEEGHYNLLNVTSFPCFRECALGMDCKNLGITVKNNSSPSSTATATNIDDNGSSLTRGDSLMLIVLIISIAMFP